MLNRVITPAPAPGPIEMPAAIPTRRATLRELRADDAAALSEQAGDYDIAKMTCTIPYPLPKVSAEIWLLLNQSARGRALQFNYAICPHDSRELRGVVGVFQNRSGNWELGYWVSRAVWGQGYATEAATAVIKAFTNAVGPADLLAGVFVDNPASVRVLSKLGFKPTGRTDNLFSMARLKTVPGRQFIRESDHDPQS